MNYPRIWQKLFWLGFDQRHTTYIGVGFILLFVAGACLVLPHLSNARIALIMAAVLSPAALLCVERANNDLLMFFLVAVSVVAARRRPVLSTAVILLGFVLKLYPVFATAVLLRADRTLFLRCVSVIFVFALIYVFATFADLVLVREATPRSTDLAYGIDVFWMKAASLAPTWGIETFARVLCYLAALLSLSCAFVTLLRDDLPEVFRIDSVYLDSFRAGAAVYVGTFLLGNNWDYRLLFLVFTIPQLLVWANCPVRHVSWLARITLLAVYSSLWYLMVVLDFLPYGFVVSLAICEISKWTAFACLAYLLSLSAPHWIKQYGEKLRSLTYLRKG